ncbi:MAG: anaerobic ribonucleoside-triphosphate reductase activating protein [Clostridiales bacterium]|nr:anaerobic ribonucleoside-triphosphate reductase activating protein [Clostridiales bacterium]
MLNLAGFANDSITDGPGIRFTVFAQGCPHGCAGCHNPQTHAFGKGKAWTEEDVMAKIVQNPLVRGVTFSGGEPFCQAEGFYRLAVLLKERGYELAAYTGYTLEELLALEDPYAGRLLLKLDVLVDGRFVLSKRDLTLRFRGSANQRIINVPQSLAAGKCVLEASQRWVGDELRGE